MHRPEPETADLRIETGAQLQVRWRACAKAPEQVWAPAKGNGRENGTREDENVQRWTPQAEAGVFPAGVTRHQGVFRQSTSR